MRTRNRFLPVGVSLSSEVTSSALKKKKKKSQPASIDSLGQSKQELCFVVIWCRGTFFLIFFSAWSWQVQTLRPVWLLQSGPERPPFRPKRSGPVCNQIWSGILVRFGLPGLKTGSIRPPSAPFRPGFNPHLPPSRSDPDRRAGALVGDGARRGAGDGVRGDGAAARWGTDGSVPR